MSYASPEITWYNARDFVTPYRLGIVAKYMYAQAFEWGVQSSWQRDIYHAYMQARCKCKREKQHKQCFNDFVASFQNMCREIKKNGFDANKSVVFVRLDNKVDDGGHRIATCLLYDKKFAGVISPEKYFRVMPDVSATALSKPKSRGGINKKYVDSIVLQYCMLKENTRVAVLFPAASVKHEDLSQVFNFYGASIYEKNVTLTECGQKALLSKIFANNSVAAEWFPRDHKPIVRVVFFEAPTPAMQQACEQELSRLCKDNRYAFYVTPTYNESMELAQTFLNGNSIDFLNQVSADVSKELNAAIDAFKQFLHERQINSELFCLVGDTVTALRNGHSCTTLSFICHEYNFCEKDMVYVSCLRNCNAVYNYDSKAKDDIIFNPGKHFYYRGMKCALNVS
jgi:hypothetical protein